LTHQNFKTIVDRFDGFGRVEQKKHGNIMDHGLASGIPIWYWKMMEHATFIKMSFH